MKKIGLMMLCMLFFYGCSTEIELCDNPNHPHLYEMNVTYTWPEDGYEHPENMYIIANRIFNTIRYQFGYDLVEEKGRLIAYLKNPADGDSDGPVIQPEDNTPEETPDDNDTSDETTEGETTEGEAAEGENPARGDEGDSESEGGDNSGTEGDTEGGEGDSSEGDEGSSESGEGSTEGEGDSTDGDEGDAEDSTDDSTTPEDETPEQEVIVYSDFSVRAGHYQMVTVNQNDDFYISGLEAFMGDVQVSSRTLGLSYHTFDVPHVKGQLVENWTEFNKGYRFIQSSEPVYYDLQDVDTEDGRVNIHFTPQTLTQAVTLNFQVKLSGQYVVIDSIRGEISGVCPDLELFTGYLNMDATQSCRVLFDAQTQAMAADSLVACSATVHVPGVINSEDELMRTGPGVLYLAVYARVVDASGNTLAEKTCYGGANLRPYLLKQPSVKLVEDMGFHHVIATPELEITIQEVLPIHRNEIWQITEPEGNIDYWFKEETGQGDHDIEV